jgi:hypothetical protein
MERLVVYASRRGRVGKLAAGLALLAAGAAVISRGWAPWIGWFLVLVGGISTAILPRSLGEDTERLVIDDAGVRDSSLPVGTIGWEEVRDAAVRQIGSVRVVALTVRDPEPFLRRLPAGRQFIARKALEADLPGIYLTLVGTEARAEDIAQAPPDRGVGPGTLAAPPFLCCDRGFAERDRRQIHVRLEDGKLRGGAGVGVEPEGPTVSGPAVGPQPARRYAGIGGTVFGPNLQPEDECRAARCAPSRRADIVGHFQRPAARLEHRADAPGERMRSEGLPQHRIAELGDLLPGEIPRGVQHPEGGVAPTKLCREFGCRHVGKAQVQHRQVEPSRRPGHRGQGAGGMIGGQEIEVTWVE